MNKIFLDCGAYNGCSLELFSNLYKDHREYNVFSFEINQSHNKDIFSTANRLKFKKFNLINKGVWINGGKKIFNGWEFTNKKTDKENPRPKVWWCHKCKRYHKHDYSSVSTIDFSNFIKNNFSVDDFIVLKMDIEGAEYKVINKMFTDKTLNYISVFFGELHGPKKGFSIQDNNLLLHQINQYKLKLLNWDAQYDKQNRKPLEIVPIGYEKSFNIKNSNKRLGHSYILSDSSK